MPVTLSGNTVIRNTTAALPFNPGTLFDGGANGAWYDPSDATTLFTTSAGTTPCAAPGAGALVVVGRMLDKSGNGNHANAANDTTARPELSARVNLLTYTEQFDNAAWTQINIGAFGGGGSIANTSATTDPLGGNTADYIVENTTNAGHGVTAVGVVTAALGTVFKFSVYAKKAQRSWLRLFIGGVPDSWFNLDNGTLGTVGAGITASISSAGNGWYLCSISGGISFSPVDAGIRINTANNETGYVGTDPLTDPRGIYIWGADLRPANIGANVPAYQRVADQYTYDTVGFPRYLRFDGVDDAMSTPANVNLSGTDKATVFAGVRKLSDAAVQIIYELSATESSNNGSFVSYINPSASEKFVFGSRGSAPLSTAKTTSTNYNAPITTVFTGLGNISGDLSTLRINGAQIDQNTADQGTGNYGTYPLFIGARNKASLFLTGYLYSLIVVGAAATATQISQTEQYVAGKTGISIP